MTLSRRVFAIRHVAFEDLGILTPLLTQRGYRIEYLDAGMDALTDGIGTADLLVVLGGPIGVYDHHRYPFLTEEVSALAARLRRNLPTLGVCLGAQLIAAALGAAVTPAPGGTEIGYGAVEFTAAGRDSPLAALGDTPVLHWHNDQFAIPDDALRLAATPGFPHQAFSLGPNILGLQFHLEADHTQLERWLIGHAHELASLEIDLALLRSEAARIGPELATRATQVFDTWLDHLTPTTR
jgi:GMP synthase (glutamine-hydrolysing)